MLRAGIRKVALVGQNLAWHQGVLRLGLRPRCHDEKENPGADGFACCGITWKGFIFYSQNNCLGAQLEQHGTKGFEEMAHRQIIDNSNWKYQTKSWNYMGRGSGGIGWVAWSYRLFLRVRRDQSVPYPNLFTIAHDHSDFRSW